MSDQALDENRNAVSGFLHRLQMIYHIDHECDKANMTNEQRTLERQARFKPIMEEIRKWMETEGVRYSQSSLMARLSLMHIPDEIT
nr:transposase [Phocaeicola coprocola]